MTDDEPNDTWDRAGDAEWEQVEKHPGVKDLADQREIEAAERLSERYAYSKAILQLQQHLTVNQRRKKPRGHPPGSTVEPAVLDKAIEELRRARMRVTKENLYRAVPYHRTTVISYLQTHPGAWERLRARWLEVD